MTRPESLAFPFSYKDSYTGEHKVFSGLNKREYFAIQIMAAMQTRAGKPEYEIEAHFAIKAADALINELNKKQTT
jgi:hypothetical protein